jgi:major histocompatibility complex class I
MSIDVFCILDASGEQACVIDSVKVSSRPLRVPGVVVHAFNPSTPEAEAEAGGFLSSRPAWSTK